MEPAKPIVTVESLKLPVTIKEETKSKSKIVEKPSPIKEAIAEEMRKLQTHDPDIVPVAGGGYGARDDIRSHPLTHLAMAASNKKK